MFIRNIIGAALDLVYPPALYCICCHKIIDSSRPYRLCNECMDGMKWVQGRTCNNCGKRLSPANPGEICFNCREHSHEFDKGFTCAEYGTHERAVIFALKYDGRTDIAPTIGEIMYDRMIAEYGEEELAQRYDIVLPVPIHVSKMSERGFNQAGLIADAFASRTGLDCDDDILVRVRETHKMRSLSPEQRRENIRGAFEIRRRRRAEIADKRLLLVDDIYTTGATVDEIARILKEAGATSVDILTFAAGADVVKA